MGVAPFAVVLTAGVKSQDAVSLLGKRTHNPAKSLAVKYLTRALQWRVLKMLLWVEEVSTYYSSGENFQPPKVLRTPDGKWLWEAAERAREDTRFLM